MPPAEHAPGVLAEPHDAVPVEAADAEGKATAEVDDRGPGDDTRRREERHGDLYVHVQIAVPTQLSAEQRTHLEAFAKSFGETPSSSMEESFFEKAKKFFK
jgi:DnaJ-class molecular chaperone